MQTDAPNLSLGNCGGKWFQVVEKDPQTVCAPFSLLVCGLRSVGVLPHPAFGFSKFTDERGHFWRWVLAPKSKDGIYNTADLVKWWNDPEWLKANPQHEFAIVRAALQNMAVQAAEIREKVGVLVVKKGRMEAHIPENASPARKQHLLDQLEGRIKVGTPFIEPSATPALSS